MTSAESPPKDIKAMYDDCERRSITAQEAEPIQAPGQGDEVNKRGRVTREKLITTLIISFCNLINFMDRYALPGIVAFFFLHISHL